MGRGEEGVKSIVPLGVVLTTSFKGGPGFGVCLFHQFVWET